MPSAKFYMGSSITGVNPNLIKRTNNIGRSNGSFYVNPNVYSKRIHTFQSLKSGIVNKRFISNNK